MMKSPQPSVGVMKWLALAEDLDDLFLSVGSICCAAEAKRRNLSKANDHQQLHNHQNLICYIQKSHASLDFLRICKTEIPPYAAVLHAVGYTNKDGEIN